MAEKLNLPEGAQLSKKAKAQLFAKSNHRESPNKQQTKNPEGVNRTMGRRYSRR